MILQALLYQWQIVQYVIMTNDSKYCWYYKPALNQINVNSRSNSSVIEQKYDQ